MHSEAEGLPQREKRGEHTVKTRRERERTGVQGRRNNRKGVKENDSDKRGRDREDAGLERSREKERKEETTVHAAIRSRGERDKGKTVLAVEATICRR